jgi:aminomethyltransferase
LRRLLANDVARIHTPGKALYSCMLNERGGVIDDLIVYFMNDDWYRMVVNAATRAKDLAWIEVQAEGTGVAIRERDDLAMIAVQGPNARDKAHAALGTAIDPARELKPFFAAPCPAGEYGELFVARTGYTGEDGYEIMVGADQAARVWDALLTAGVQPIGLGARDTLRLEAGMNLYGQDMDETVTPLASGLGWTVAMADERDFIGREALQAQKAAGGIPRFVGVVLEGRGVLRSHQKLFDGEREVGEITSGGFSPTLERSIGMARVAADAGDSLQVDIRGKKLPLRRVKMPFVRNGQAQVEI